MMKGIDVSTHNGNINFTRVKNAGIQFAMVRAGYGQGHIDAQFKRNIKGFADAGIAVGAYWFLYSLTPDEARKEADYFNAALAPYKDLISFPVACDFEYDSENWMRRCGVTPSKRRNTDIVLAFCKRMESFGWYTMNYTNKDFMFSHFYQPELARFDTWYARPGYNKPDVADVGILQYSFDGSVAGIAGRVDMNEAYKDYPEIIKGKKTAQKPSNKADKPHLVVDGDWSRLTTLALQNRLKTTADGIVSNQPVSNQIFLPNCNEYSWQFDRRPHGGSQVIKALQTLIGAQADGYCGYHTVVRLQQYLNKTIGADLGVDGQCGPGTVKALQQWLNK